METSRAFMDFACISEWSSPTACPTSRRRSTCTGRTTDSGTPCGALTIADRGGGRILDLRGLLDPDDQREVARIYISAFLEYSLRGNGDYLPLFRDHRVAGGWLPKTMYVTRFEDHTFRSLASFEEDIDVTTGSVAGVTLMGDSLGTWRERELLLRSRNRPTTLRIAGESGSVARVEPGSGGG